MPHYQLYTLFRDGHMRGGADLYAGDDGEAVELARIRLEHRDLELWQGSKKVAVVPKDGLPIFWQR